jgi:hypothetical protein
VIGFWGTIRLLMPVIEHVAKIFYRGNLSKNERIAGLLKRFGFSCPLLTWQLYRNSLLHIDRPSCIVVGGVLVYWDIAMLGEDQKVEIFKQRENDPSFDLVSNHTIIVGMDTRRLYDDMICFLDEEIKKKSKRRIKIEHLRRYFKSRKTKEGKVEHFNRGILREIEKVIEEKR